MRKANFWQMSPKCYGEFSIIFRAGTLICKQNVILLIVNLGLGRTRLLKLQIKYHFNTASKYVFGYEKELPQSVPFSLFFIINHHEDNCSSGWKISNSRTYFQYFFCLKKRKYLCFQRITFPENMSQMFDCLVLTYIGNLLPGIF